LRLTKYLIILYLTLLTLDGHAAFTENSRRYLGPRDIFNLWAQKFPASIDPTKNTAVDASCWSVTTPNMFGIPTTVNMNVIGAVNPAFGKPASALPPPGFVRWMSGCANSIVALQFSDLVAQPTNDLLWKKYFAPAIVAKYRDATNVQNPYHLLLETQWTVLSPDLKDALVRYSIEEMIGPEPVIQDLGIAKSIVDLVSLIESTLSSAGSISDAAQKIWFATALREEFISY
jgi:hypothetical protein